MKDALLGAAAMGVVFGIGYLILSKGQRQASREEADEDEIQTRRPVSPTKKLYKDLYDNVVDSEADPVQIMRNIPVVRDHDGLLSEDTLIKIFDKRNNIGGIRALQREFRQKRRDVIQNAEEYKQICIYYHDKIERKREENLEELVRVLGITMDDIDDAQQKHLSERSLTFISGRRELENIEIPPWLTFNEAARIYEELKEMLTSELASLNCLMGQEEREQEEVKLHYKMQDLL